MENSDTVLLSIAAAIGSAYLGLLGYMLYKSKRASEIDAENKASINVQIADMNTYKALHFTVLEERDQIKSKLNGICNTSLINHYQTYQGCTFFSGKLSVDSSHEQTDMNQLLNSLLTSFQQYPQFSLETARSNVSYVPQLYDELYEHHTKVTMLADEYFRRLDDIESQVKNAIATSNLNISYK